MVNRTNWIPAFAGMTVPPRADNEILKVMESKYFFCEKFGKQIAKAICIHRQKMLDDIADLERLHNCKDCDQGKKIAQEPAATVREHGGMGENP